MKSIFKKFGVFLLIVITLNGILFLALSFYNLNFNPSVWSFVHRGISGFIFCIISLGSLVFVSSEIV